MEISNNEKSYLVKVILVLAVVVSLYFAVKIISEIKNYNNIPKGSTAINTISFEGEGEVSASPDLATISFTIRESSVDMKSAQAKVTTKETAMLAFLDKSGIVKKDIKTESYNSFPKYEYRNAVCPQPLTPQYYPSGDVSSSVSPVYCPSGKQVLTGYEVSEYVSVKVRDLSKAGEILKGIGAVGISEMNGPNFSIEKEEQFKAQARKIAIDEAKAKAEVLAKDLGVHLVRIVSFSENGYYPMYGNREISMMDGSVSSAKAPAPELPTGENKITSNVTITYEIR